LRKLGVILTELINGDCLEVLSFHDSNSVDALVTDPPAGISFMGKEWDHHKGGRDEWITWMSVIMRECLRVMKPGAMGLVWAIPRTSHWTATALENAGFEVRDVVTHLFGSGFPKSLDISKAINKAAGAEREPNETAPSTDAEKQWQGWGTALKPASEHWILVRKPCSEKTVAANVLKHGTGGINIDASRIEGKLEGDPHRFNKTDGGWGVAKFNDAPVVRGEGRFPANLVLSHSPHCTDSQCDIECAVKMLDEQSGNLGKSAGGNSAAIDKGIYNKRTGDKKAKLGVPCGFGDSGGASRFFYCAKISSSERGDGNTHPTVKPKKLMSYLIRMITPPGGTVLDPFMGSGSTGIAAKECGFEFIGVEKEKEYFDIAEKRIKV
jgi:hypothetical protein